MAASAMYKSINLRRTNLAAKQLSSHKGSGKGKRPKAKAATVAAIKAPGHMLDDMFLLINDSFSHVFEPNVSFVDQVLPLSSLFVMEGDVQTKLNRFGDVQMKWQASYSRNDSPLPGSDACETTVVSTQSQALREFFRKVMHRRHPLPTNLRSDRTLKNRSSSSAGSVGYSESPNPGSYESYQLNSPAHKYSNDGSASSGDWQADGFVPQSGYSGLISFFPEIPHGNAGIRENNSRKLKARYGQQA